MLDDGLTQKLLTQKLFGSVMSVVFEPEDVFRKFPGLSTVSKYQERK